MHSVDRNRREINRRRDIREIAAVIMGLIIAISIMISVASATSPTSEFPEVGVSASSIPILPCEISGTVTINGEPAPVGVIVAAIIDGEEVARITITEPEILGGSGPFDERIVIQSGDDGIAPEISFLIHGYPAEETIIFESGEGFMISITQTVLKGDLNGNGRVDIGDVSQVAYMAVGLIEEELRGDFSYDGTVKAADAARIAYYYVGKIPAL